MANFDPDQDGDDDTSPAVDIDNDSGGDTSGNTGKAADTSVGGSVRGAFSQMDSQTGASITKAVDVVKAALGYGRAKHGLGGEQQAPAQGSQQGGEQSYAEGGAVNIDDDRFGDTLSENVEDRRGDAYGKTFKNEKGDIDLQRPSGKGQKQNTDEGVVRKPRMNFAEGGAVEDDQAQFMGSNADQQPEPDAPLAGRQMSGKEATGGFDAEQMYTPPAGPTSGASPLAGQRQSGEQAANVNPKRILAYLQGADAEHPEQVQATEQKVDPRGQMSEEDRKLAAVEAAQKQGGPEAAFRVVQHYRQKYDAYRGFASAALASGDIEGAVKAANQSYPNMLDGNTVQFAPNAGGVTATVMTDGKPGQPVSLTVPQFNEWLAGNAGQYDNVMDVGAPKVLQSLTQTQGKTLQAPQQSTMPQLGNAPPIGSPAPQPAQQQDPNDTRPMAAPGVGAPGQYRQTPPGYQSPPEPDMTTDSPERRTERARLLHGGQNGGGANIAAQTQSVMDQEEKAEASKTARIKAESPFGVAQERAKATVAASGNKLEGVKYNADVRAAAYQGVNAGHDATKVEQARAALAAKLDHENNANARTALGEQGRIAKQALQNLQVGQPIPKNIQSMLDRIIKPDAGGQAPQAPQQQAPQAPQRQAPQAPGQPEAGTRQQFKQGWGVWNGKAWVPEK